MTAPLAALPLCTLILAGIAFFPRTGTVAPVRLAVMRGALLTGLVGAFATEGLSALHLVTGTALLIVWLVALVGCLLLAARRLGWTGWRRRPGVPDWRELRGAGWRRLREYSWSELTLVGVLLVLALAELIIALVAAPNNADSQTYHLPRIEHWVQDHSVAFYPTPIHRQIGFSPGAEYLLLQLRLLAGPEEFYNLVQLAAGLGCVLVASRIAAQLGAGRRGQLLAAITVATAPMVLLEATSTQTDLVAAFWVAAGTSLALAGLAGRARWPEVAWLGAAVGMTALTKVNGLGTLAPFLLVWGVGQLWPLRRDRATWWRLTRAAAATALILGIGVAVAGPFTLRAEREWGSLAGDPGEQIIALGRHDPAAVSMNALRIAATVLATTSTRVNGKAEHELNDLAATLHLPARDGKLTFTALPFTIHNSAEPDEDYAAYPIQALAVLAGIGYALLGRRRTGMVRGYAAAAAVSLLATAALVAWQPWINRLILPTFVIGAPLAGWAAGDLLDRLAAALKDAQLRDRLRFGHGIRLSRGLLAGVLGLLVLGVGVRAGVAVWSGQPRPLGGATSVLTVSREDDRYVRGGWRQEPYQTAARQVAASGAHRVGLIQNYVSWEYPWWVELRRAGVDPTIVNLVSILPRTPPPSIQSVDAVICTLGATQCAKWLPHGWRASTYLGVMVLLRPRPLPQPTS